MKSWIYATLIAGVLPQTLSGGTYCTNPHLCGIGGCNKPWEGHHSTVQEKEDGSGSEKGRYVRDMGIIASKTDILNVISLVV